MMQIEEEWKSIKNHIYYEVSNCGRVRSLDRWVNHSNRRAFWRGRVLAPRLSDKGYYSVALPDGKSHYIHRLVAEAFLGLEPGQDIDHIDHNPINNCISNLRACSRKQNNGNRKLNKRNTNGYKGIKFDSKSKRWRVVFTRKHIGCFSSPEEAARAYDEAAVKYFGEFALTNKKMGLLP